MKSLIEKTSDKLVNAFLKNKIIAPIPSKFCKKINEAQKLRRLCESKIKLPVIGFKAAGTGIPLIKKLKEKEPFYASVYEKNVLKNGKIVKINKSTLGIELEVCYFGSNIKFLIWSKKKYKKINVGNLKTNISNKKINQSVNGNTNTVYINPLNSLRFVLNKVKKDKKNLNKDFWVFTGSSVGVVPIKGKGIFIGKINKLGSVKAVIK